MLIFLSNEALYYRNLIATLSGHKHIDNIKLINKVKVITTRGFIRPLDLDEYPMRYIHVKIDCHGLFVLN
ncbi:MAG: hypothetical protein L3J47_07495 [Sulfurovum sp.]|nr:hypothetical protein [Sulfurovum sp.]